MKTYLDLLDDVLTNGVKKTDRTGTGTFSVFGRQVRFNLSDGFPLLTTKKLHIRSIVHELLWFISGSTNTGYLTENGVTIWDEWADEKGDLGPVYGKQWRSWPVYKRHRDTPGFYPDRNIDQLKEVLGQLKTNPDSRRHVVSAWNVADLDQMALAPCHCLFQFNVSPLGREARWMMLNHKRQEFFIGDHGEIDAACDEAGIPRHALDLQLYQRSADIFLGVPFNIASYALLLKLVARHCGYAAGDFIHTFGDLHLYANHVEQARKQLARTPSALPQVILGDTASKNLFDVRFDDIAFVNYRPQPAIKAPVAV